MTSLLDEADGGLAASDKPKQPKDTKPLPEVTYCNHPELYMANKPSPTPMFGCVHNATCLTCGFGWGMYPHDMLDCPDRLATVNDMADERPDDPQKPLESVQSPPQEAGVLREQIQQYIKAAYLHGLPVENLDTGELEPPRDISDVAWITDAIMQAVKAELGAALLKELEELITHINAFEEYMSEPNQELKNVNHLILNRITELRNHFGIGEDV